MTIFSLPLSSLVLSLSLSPSLLSRSLSLPLSSLFPSLSLSLSLLQGLELWVAMAIPGKTFRSTGYTTDSGVDIGVHLLSITREATL